MDEAAAYDNVLGMIAENYRGIEKSIVNQLFLEVSNHYPTVGSYREAVWESLFKMIIPKKYCIEQGVFIIDSHGNKSREVDLAIFDELYTPYIFNYGKIKFIPIEAVAAVVQCKSKNLNDQAIEEWELSIKKLNTSRDSVARMAYAMVDNSIKSSTTQSATRPIKILCTLAGRSISEKYEENFDIILSADEKKKNLYKKIPNESQSLEEWNNSLNHAAGKPINSEDKKDEEGKEKSITTNRKHLLLDLKVVKDGKDNEQDENVILSLIFQLNQLLMVINNPMLFPHRAYAEQFSKIINKQKKDKGEDGNGK